MEDFDKEYEKWQNRVKRDFLSNNPTFKKSRCEIFEDGTVCVHVGKGAYPLEFKGYEKWQDA